MAVRVTNGSVFSVGIDYTDTDHNHLPSSADDAEAIETYFATWGYKPRLKCCTLDVAESDEIQRHIEKWSDELRAQEPGSNVVFYLAGHGRIHDGKHWVLSAKSPGAPPYFGSKALAADRIVESVINSGASSAVVLLDTCYSAHAAHEIEVAVQTAAAHVAGPTIDVAILVPSLRHEKSYSGLFIPAILESLTEGSKSKSWRDGDQFVSVMELRNELRHRLQDDQCAFVAGRDGIKVFPNPRYRADAPDRAVQLDTLLARLDESDREHFLSKAAGADASDLEWYFTGREGPSQAIVTWLRETTEGVLVVTGSPGSGKSAVLGRLAILSDPTSQNACHALGLRDDDSHVLPAVGTFDAILHLKNLRLPDVARAIGVQLDIDLSGSTRPERDLHAHLIDHSTPVTVLVDALDEADAEDQTLIARDVLRAIANLPNSRVVVGTRTDKDGRMHADHTGHGPLVSAVSSRKHQPTIINIDDHDATDDITTYIRNTLSRTATAANWPNAPKRLAAAKAVAEQAAGNFLYARFAAKALANIEEPSDADWTSRIPGLVGPDGFDALLLADLNRFDDPERVRDVLTALAYAEGPGLPRRDIWPIVATNLAGNGSGRAYTPADIATVIREAGWYLIEGTSDGQAVYRLFHQAVADSLRRARREATP